MKITHRPSSAARTVQCPGSVRLAIPEIETEQAAEGTLAHNVASGKVKTDDPEMLAAVKIYLDDVKMISKTCGATVQYESFIMCSNIHSENGGTPDAWMYDRIGKSLWVWDFKYGHGYVDHVENWQLINYAAGLLAQLNETEVEVIMTVIQPRCYDKRGPVRRWRMTARTLEPYFERLRAAYAATHYSDAPCVTGPECDYCSARHICTALQRSAYRGAELAQANDVAVLSGTALGVELSILRNYRDRMDARITGLEAQAEQIMRVGERVTGFHLEQTFGREKWVDVEMAKMMFGDSIIKPEELVTPKQAIAAGCDEELVASLIDRAPGKVKIVSDGTQLIGVFNSEPK